MQMSWAVSESYACNTLTLFAQDLVHGHLWLAVVRRHTLHSPLRQLCPGSCSGGVRPMALVLAIAPL
jgi:hypothetical protein